MTMNNTVKESIEYRLAIVEQQLNMLKLQQDDFKQLGKELNNIVIKTQMYDMSLSDMKERLDDHKNAMKTLREEIKAERVEFLAAQKEFQRDNADKMDKVQAALLNKLDDFAVSTEEKLKSTKKDDKGTTFNLTDGTLQLIMKVILALIGIIAAVYGVKLL